MSDKDREKELLSAAVRYVAVADWFEKLPMNHREPQRDRGAMELFNRVEAELRQAGDLLLRKQGYRELILQNVLPEAVR